MFCKSCHGWKELEYHPNYYRTKKCPNIKNCKNKRFCCYYHNETERRMIKDDPFFKIVPKNRIVEDEIFDDQNQNDVTKKFSLEDRSLMKMDRVNEQEQQKLNERTSPVHGQQNNNNNNKNQ